MENEWQQYFISSRKYVSSRAIFLDKLNSRLVFHFNEQFQRKALNLNFSKF